MCGQSAFDFGAVGEYTMQILAYEVGKRGFFALDGTMKTLTALVIFVLGSAAVFGESSDLEYYAILVDGKKIGHVVQTRSVADGVVTTTEDMTMSLSRGAVSLTVQTVEKSIETTGGRPLGFEVEQNISGMGQKTTGKVVDGRAEVVMEAMGTTQKRTIDWPEGAVMSEGLRLLQKEKGLKEGTKYEAMVFSPSILVGMKAAVEVGGTSDVDLFGRVLKLAKVQVTMQMPTGAMTSTSYVNDSFRAMKTQVPTMGMNMEIVACDKQFAMSDNDVVDFLDKLLVDSPTELKDVRSKKWAQYTLVPANGAKLSISSDDSQVVKGSNGKVVLEVSPVSAGSGVAFPYSGSDAKVLEAMRPTQYLESDNAKVAELARAAVGDSKDAAEAVRKIESFVAGYISSKDLSVGYASAAEVAVSRQGDCTEHAVLAAAMCRAVGIPARVAFGLVYVEELLGRKNVFGGHAWTQAYVGDKWVSLDATRAPNGYGVGHILLATGNGDPADFFSMVNTLGYFKIEKVVLK